MDKDTEPILTLPRNLSIPRDRLNICTNSKFNRRKYSDLERDIGLTWNQRTIQNPRLWNGTKFRLDSFIADDDKHNVTFNVGITCYRDFICTNMSENASDLQRRGLDDYDNPQAYMSDAMGVGSLLRTSDDHVVLLQRCAWCGEAQGLWDIPGGHAEPQELVGKMSVDEIEIEKLPRKDIVNEIYDSVLREIRDEVGIPLSTLTDPTIMGVSRNRTSTGRPSVNFYTECTWSSHAIQEAYNKSQHLEADESTGIKFIHIKDLMEINKNIDIWSSMAPSAKGCIRVYAGTL